MQVSFLVLPPHPLWLLLFYASQVLRAAREVTITINSTPVVPANNADFKKCKCLVSLVLNFHRNVVLWLWLCLQ